MKKLTIIAVFIIWCVLRNTAIAQDLSINQRQYISIYCKKYLGDNTQWPIIMEGIRKTECSKPLCGKSSKEGDNSWGPWQIQPDTARDVMRYLGIDAHLTDEQIIHKLLYDVRFSTMIAIRYFGFLWKKFNDLDLAVMSYNYGPGNVENHLKEKRSFPPKVREYLLKVKKEMGGGK